MDFIDGIGGVFIFSNQPQQLADWYRLNLGIDFESSGECGSFYKNFDYRDASDPSKELATTWAILGTDEKIENSPRTGQVNYRVKSLEKTLSHLKENGIKVDKTEEYEYGKFAWIKDPEGNNIELYEPTPTQ